MFQLNNSRSLRAIFLCTGTHVTQTNRFVNSVSGLIACSLGQEGSLGSPIVNTQGLLVGLQNGTQFVSIGSVLTSATTVPATDLMSSFLPPQGLALKPVRLVDAGVSVTAFRATAFIIFENGTNFGTGFLCKWNGKRFVITNFHVLGLMKNAKEAWLEFWALSPVLRIKLDPSKVHLVDKFLDFALISISKASLRDLKFVEPLELSNASFLDEVALQILGYPLGKKTIFPVPA